MSTDDERRSQLSDAYQRLMQDVSATLFRLDPVGINFESNTDEYDPEATTIIARLRGAASVTDVQRIVHEEFIRWFDPVIAGPPERYAVAADEIWALWKASALAGPNDSPAEGM